MVDANPANRRKQPPQEFKPLDYCTWPYSITVENSAHLVDPDFEKIRVGGRVVNFTFCPDKYGFDEDGNMIDENACKICRGTYIWKTGDGLYVDCRDIFDPETTTTGTGNNQILAFHKFICHLRGLNVCRFHTLPNSTLCQISHVAEFHTLPNSTLCRIPRFAKFHTLPNSTLCQISHFAKFHTLPNFTLCQISHFANCSTSKLP